MTFSTRFTATSGRFWLAFTVAVGEVHAQAYTYDPPTCGVPYRDEVAKPQALRVVSEMNAANQCIAQNKYPMACEHLRGALDAADRMGPESGSPDGIKVQLKTMMKTYACR